MIEIGDMRLCQRQVKARIEEDILSSGCVSGGGNYMHQSSVTLFCIDSLYLILFSAG